MPYSLRGRHPHATLSAVRARYWLVLAVLAGAAWMGMGLLARRRPPALGSLAATPSSERLSVRVGERVQFSANAEGTASVSWSVWGRPVSHGSTFTFAPGAHDTGWQSVTVEVSGVDGSRLTRTWDVGVVPAVAPELTEVAPPAGTLVLMSGEEARLRCSARVPAARSSDRLRFEWLLDGRPLRLDERPAGAGASEIVLSAPAPGEHTVALRVSEDERVASVTEWTLKVAPPAPPAEPAAPAEAPPPPAAPAPSPPPAAVAPAPPRVVRAPGTRRVEGDVGETLAFAIAVEPGDAAVTYAWSVDRRRVRETGRELRYRTGTAGAHRVAVDVHAAGRRVGGDVWTVAVRPPTPPLAAAPTTTTLPPAVVAAAPRPAERPAQPAPPSALAEGDVRRWLDEYARAWSRKDTAALRRMGQIRSAAEAERMERYFASIDDLDVRVRVLAVAVDGDHASVEFERTDTLTDPSGRRQEHRLPPVRREIERTPSGLRFAPRDGRG